MIQRHKIPPLKSLCMLGILALCVNTEPLNAQEGQANKPRVNNEKPGSRGQVKRVHPHALKLILRGKKEEAIAYLKETAKLTLTLSTLSYYSNCSGQKMHGSTMLKLGFERALPNTH